MDTIIIVGFVAATALMFGGLYLDKRAAQKSGRNPPKSPAVPPR